ncbi:MAG: PDZ domain-containing protein [Bacteroidetes bacterium]|jgi:tricorn protease|nr:PDZ domain-containing protein [Bacteroidota bacterium]MBT4398243.1 PDZ domain-containing protein [Bacteroidota bacterium]MBT4409028.1 PDZ domain-containing protein [Bacteroidota bacterium]MBT7463807.1 PDZ domain-containing protein [Bacteroidota bacterium]
MNRFIISIFILGLMSTNAMTQTPHFLSYPALSPDAASLVFSFEGDLWQSDMNTGKAMRLTAMQGYETAAKFSPDGKWIAFTGRQFGNADIFVIPAGGGEIRQLTYHAANDEMENWTWDSKEILIRSSRENSSSIYKIPVDGGNPLRLFNHYFNVIHNVAIHPSSGEIFFNDTWESLRMTSRKRYRGEYDPDIQSYNPQTGDFKVYTDWNGKDMWATIDKHGNIYYVSDEQNGEYNLYTLSEGQPKALTKFKTSVIHPSVCANGSLLVFEKDYQLFTYNPLTKKVLKLEFRMIRNNLLPTEQSFKVDSKISHFDVSPDNKKIAFISRGELFVCDIKGKFIRNIERPGTFERAHEIKWMSDNKTLLFNQTWKGYLNLFSIQADGGGEMKQLTRDLRNNRSLRLDKKRTKAAYLSGRDEIRLIELEKYQSETIVRDEFWGFQNSKADFSPDGKWLTYSAKHDFEDDIFVINLESKKITNLTNTGISESAPVWSLDGKYMYMVTNQLRPSFPRGAGDVHLYRMALDNFDKDYKLDQFDELFNQDTSKKKKDPIINISINTDRIWERMERISPGFGSQGGATAIRQGKKEIVYYSSNHDKGASALWKTSLEVFEKAKTEKVVGLTGRANVLVNGTQVYALSGGNLYTVNVSTNKATKIAVSHAFTRNLSEEFKQMFAQTWANVEENFYHEELHGEDWAAHKKYYKQFLPFLNNRGDLRTLLNDLLGEMNSSHMGFNTSGTEEQTALRYVSLEPGILYKDDQPFIVDRVLARSAADKKGIDIQQGDELVAVNGKRLNPDMPRDYYFYRPAMELELLLTFKREGVEKEVKIHPGGSLSRNLYDEWIDENSDRVKSLSKDKIAYAHMKNMGGGEINKFIMTMTRELNGKEGLILDLRYNTGGNVHDELIRFLQQRTYLQWKSRGGTLSNQSNFAPSDYPIVLLINEQSLSDAEMTAAGFKELGLGTIIGTETYRWIIFTSSMRLVDGSSHRMPGWGCYTLDGRNLEQEGVGPDVYVKQTFVDRLQGKDPQIEKAVEHILK